MRPRSKVVPGANPVSGVHPMVTEQLPYEPPDPAMVERIDKALQRHLRERNRRDTEQQERAADRVLERLCEGIGE
jgi:hypothetical protein